MDRATDRRRPGNGEDRLLLRDLVHDAEARLVGAYGDPVATRVAANLGTAARRVDVMEPGALGEHGPVALTLRW